MKRSINYIVALVLLVTFPVTGLGLTVFHHHCSITNEDNYSINSGQICNCHHEDDKEYPADAHCGLPDAGHAKHEHSSKKHSHLHTKDHCSHCKSIDNAFQLNISKHCCETTAKASAPVAVFAQPNRLDIAPSVQILDFERTSSILNFSSEKSSALQYKPPSAPNQHASIILYILVASKYTSSEDSDSDC